MLCSNPKLTYGMGKFWGVGYEAGGGGTQEENGSGVGYIRESGMGQRSMGRRKV